MINGKQVMVKREPTIDGVPVDQFIADNADAMWYHQNEMWEMIDPGEFNEPEPHQRP
ncbi:hypothetical protein N9Y42_05775 [Mariniblastus sp.]|nr:hypothetical protein [Mariniblastus sp.]